MPISQHELSVMEARLEANRKGKGQRVRSAAACERESDLHEEIRQECLRRGWLPLHGSMAHRTYRTKGEPDFVILTDKRQLLLIECKAKGGKLRKEQREFRAWADKLKHPVFEVFSFADFLIVIELTKAWRGEL